MSTVSIEDIDKLEQHLARYALRCEVALLVAPSEHLATLVERASERCVLAHGDLFSVYYSSESGLETNRSVREYYDALVGRLYAFRSVVLAVEANAAAAIGACES